jgi:hypothetical protein
MVNWLIDEILTEREYETGFPTLVEAIIEAGHNLYRTKYIPFSTHPDTEVPFEEGTCTITYGSVQFCKQIEKYYHQFWTPGMYFNQNVKSFVRFALHIGADLLNDDYIILPYAEAKRRFVNQEAMFIKPESGLKEFTGQVVNYKEDFDKLVPYGEIDDTTLCVCASAKDIKAEFRYVICEGAVVTGSEYRWDDVLDVRADTHPLCDEMARKVAEADWQADKVYVCDVALVEDNGTSCAKVIELNAFSSSGLYACDTRKIVKAVSRAALREYLGDVE